MLDATRRLILNEYEPRLFRADLMTLEVGMRLDRLYGAQVHVEPPTFLTDERWRLTSRGWVGSIPLTPDLVLTLRPKVPVRNVFEMLAYAHRLRTFRFLDGLVDVASLPGFYERLVVALVEGVLARARRGFHRAYQERRDDLPFLAGRLDVGRLAGRSLMTRFPCRQEMHTSDIVDNRILAWTLHQILRSDLCAEPIRPMVRRAYLAVREVARLQPLTAAACDGRVYNRMNADYRAMHALCHLFLSHLGPTHKLGDKPTLPFLVDMARLYERFVARWLEEHLPSTIRLARQEHVRLSHEPSLHFDIDLTLYDRETGQVRCVADTKYRAPERPATEEIAQVVAYAQAKGCREAVLIYPIALTEPLDVRVGDIHVRALNFALDGDLDSAGANLLSQLGITEEIQYGAQELEERQR
jgi:5-methylcytosine-specific restriction enzyme subunit McrC